MIAPGAQTVFAQPEPLRRELARTLPARPFALRFWDGSQLEPTVAGGPVLTVRSPAAIAHMLRAPGQLGLGRAYAAGELEADDLDRVIGLLDSFQAPPIDRVTRARLTLAAVRACGLTRPPRIPISELRPRGRRHSRERDERAVRHHYDVSNEFFALFLDDSMTYSCALFSRGAATLAQAQAAKRELVATKLGLREGERILDVGCGWGSFVIHAAREHGVRALGVTLSPAQAELARRRVAEAGLEDRVEIRICDYRDLKGGAGGERFDAIASIGMVEHVGSNRIDEYAHVLARLLKPGGRLLNHGIARLRHGDAEAGPFSERYVFPDAAPLHLSRIQLALERAGFETDHVEGLRQDYIDTLSAWIDRLDSNREQAERLAGGERLRVWRLYLRAARNGFRTGFTSIYQVLAHHA
ncbi:MAG TPA: cyclopropane-fatty-acyl-phospholipid synthase family protein [Solirubrobacteraceae bacterium]|nr:cyclopropane-fatty-acyl-phospholipid synthase family protein [Solirubrobacteraceae bacterium]